MQKFSVVFYNSRNLHKHDGDHQGLRQVIAAMQSARAFSCPTVLTPFLLIDYFTYFLGYNLMVFI